MDTGHLAGRRWGGRRTGEPWTLQTPEPGADLGRSACIFFCATRAELHESSGPLAAVPHATQICRSSGARSVGAQELQPQS